MTVLYNGNKINIKAPKLEAGATEAPSAPLYITHLLSGAEVSSDFTRSWRADIAKANLVLHNQLPWTSSDLFTFNRIARKGFKGSLRLLQFQTSNTYKGELLSAIANTKIPQYFTGIPQKTSIAEQSDFEGYYDLLHEADEATQKALTWIERGKPPVAFGHMDEVESLRSLARLQYDKFSIKETVATANQYIRNNNAEECRVAILGKTEHVLQTIALANTFDSVDVSIKSQQNDPIDFSLLYYHNFLNSTFTSKKELLRAWIQTGLYTNLREREPNTPTGELINNINEWLHNAHGAEMSARLPLLFQPSKAGLVRLSNMHMPTRIPPALTSLPSKKSRKPQKTQPNTIDTVAGFGRATTDRTSLLGDQYVRMGGKIANFLVAIARLSDLHPIIIGPLSGKDNRKVLQDEGVDTSWPDKLFNDELAEIVNIQASDGSYKDLYSRVDNGWSYRQRRKLIQKFLNQKQTKRNTTAGYVVLDEAPELLMQIAEEAEKIKMPLYCNASPITSVRRLYRTHPNFFSKCSLVIANQHETEVLADGIKVVDKDTAAQAAERAIEIHGITRLVTTIGSNGIFYKSKLDNAELYVPGFPITEADATAAGDSVAATIVARGEITKRVLAEAAAVGAIVAARGKGYKGIPTREELQGDIKINENYTISRAALMRYFEENAA